MVSGSLTFCPGDWSHLGSPGAQEALFLWHVAVVSQTTPILHLAFISHLLQRADYVLPSVACSHPSSGSVGHPARSLWAPYDAAPNGWLPISHLYGCSEASTGRASNSLAAGLRPWHWA